MAGGGTGGGTGVGQLRCRTGGGRGWDWFGAVALSQSKAEWKKETGMTLPSVSRALSLESPGSSVEALVSKGGDPNTAMGGSERPQFAPARP